MTDKSNWRKRALDAEEALAAMTAYRDAYRKAKAENDERFMRERDEARAARDRLQRACDEGLPREVIPCPMCEKPHIEGPRHDGKGDGRTRPHHTHRCYHCAHEWDFGRWSFGVARGHENDVTLRLRTEGAVKTVCEFNRRIRFALTALGVVDCDDPLTALEDLAANAPQRKQEALDERSAAVLRAHAEGRAAGLREALDACSEVKGRLLDVAMEGGGPINCFAAFGEEDPCDADGGECELIAAGACLCVEDIEKLINGVPRG